MDPTTASILIAALGLAGTLTPFIISVIQAKVNGATDAQIKAALATAEQQLLSADKNLDPAIAANNAAEDAKRAAGT